MLCKLEHYFFPRFWKPVPQLGAVCPKSQQKVQLTACFRKCWARCKKPKFIHSLWSRSAVKNSTNYTQGVHSRLKINRWACVKGDDNTARLGSFMCWYSGISDPWYFPTSPFIHLAIGSSSVKGLNGPPGFGRPADFAQKRGGWGLRPEQPASRHVEFLMRSHPRWQKGAIQA